MNCFLEWQGIPAKLNNIYQDNTRSINMEENGKESLVKQTRHFDIDYFYVTELFGKNK